MTETELHLRAEPHDQTKCEVCQGTYQPQQVQTTTTTMSTSTAAPSTSTPLPPVRNPEDVKQLCYGGELHVSPEHRDEVLKRLQKIKDEIKLSPRVTTWLEQVLKEGM